MSVCGSKGSGGSIAGTVVIGPAPSESGRGIAVSGGVKGCPAVRRDGKFFKGYLVRLRIYRFNVDSERATAIG